MSTIITRIGKGSPLTNVEVDTNFTNLNTDKYESGSNASFGTLAYTGTLTGGTGVINIGSGQVYKDASGNVGIGTSSPSSAYGFSRSLGVSGSNAEVYIESPSGKWSFGTDGNGNGYFQGPSPTNTAAGTLSFNTRGSERMRIDSAGNVGIGTSSPDGKLTISGGSSSVSFGNRLAFNLFNTASSGNQSCQIAFGSAGATKNTGFIGTDFNATGDVDTLSIGATRSNGVVNFYAGGFTERMRITSAGNVGIGTSSPLLKLDVSGKAKFTGVEIGVGEEYTSNIYFEGGFKYRATGFGTVIGASSGAITFSNTASSGSAGASATVTERMRIDSAGNVGIGTTSPTAILDARGNFAVGAAAGMARIRRNTVSGSNGITLQGNTTDTIDDTNPGASISIGGGPLTDTFEGNIDIRAYGDTAGGTRNNITFSNRSGTNTVAERMRITSGGSLAVGDTTVSNGFKMRVKAGGGGGSALEVRGSSGDLSVAQFLCVKFDNNTTSSQVFVDFNINNGGAGSGRIVANGANQAAFASTSDARLKENIVDLEPQLANICALRPVEFDFIESQGGGHQIGFIAQEMQEVYPDAVGEGSPDGMLTVTGWDKTTARLVAAIQEQQAIINDLKARLDAANL
jgi:hypothetical protein